MKSCKVWQPSPAVGDCGAATCRNGNKSVISVCAVTLAKTQNMPPFANRTCQGYTAGCEHQFRECSFSWRVGFSSDFLQILPHWISSLFSRCAAFLSTDMQSLNPREQYCLEFWLQGFCFKALQTSFPPRPTLTYCWRWYTISSSLLQSDGCANKLKTTGKGNTIQRS